MSLSVLKMPDTRGLNKLAKELDRRHKRTALMTREEMFELAKDHMNWLEDCMIQHEEQLNLMATKSKLWLFFYKIKHMVLKP